MIVTLQRWGNSHEIRIPKILLDSLQWNENERLALSSVNGEIIIRKQKCQEKVLKNFLTGTVASINLLMWIGESRKEKNYSKARRYTKGKLHFSSIVFPIINKNNNFPLHI